MSELTLFPDERPDLVRLFGQFTSDEVAGGAAADDTALTYTRETRQYWEWCQARGLDPLGASRDDVVVYRRWLVGQYAASSVALRLSAVRRFYAAASPRGRSTPFSLAR